MEKLHVIADAGMYMPIDGSAESGFAFYDLHLDYSVTPILSPFIELNGISYTNDGDGTRPIKLSAGVSIPLSTAQAALGTGPFDGVDFANLGSSGDERPLTSDHEITRQRGTLSLDFEL